MTRGPGNRSGFPDGGRVQGVRSNAFSVRAQGRSCTLVRSAERERRGWGAAQPGGLAVGMRQQQIQITTSPGRRDGVSRGDRNGSGAGTDRADQTRRHGGRGASHHVRVHQCPVRLRSLHGLRVGVVRGPADPEQRARRVQALGPQEEDRVGGGRRRRSAGNADAVDAVDRDRLQDLVRRLQRGRRGLP